MSLDRPTPLMLRRLFLFQELPEKMLADLTDSMWIQHCRHGQPLWQGASTFQEVAYFVFSGIVAFSSLTHRGNRKILFFLGPGELLNLNIMGTCDDHHFGQAATDTMLLCMKRTDLAEKARTSSSLSSALIAHYEQRLWRLSHQLKNNSGSCFAERKLAAKLLKLSSDFGKPCREGLAIDFDLTITQMADYIGIPRETASRACSKLTDLGLVIYRCRRFCIPDIPRLEAFRRQP